MKFSTRKIVKPGDLNSNNTLFGGRMLEWIDEECAVYAICQLGTTSLVTKFISQLDFVSRARQGDVIEIGVEVVVFGRTSITLRCEARNKTSKQTIIKIQKVVMVCLDPYGKPTPHGCTKEKEDDLQMV